MTLPHEAIYANAALYDLAVSYRDYALECRCLGDLYQLRRRRAPRSFLELAAGPAAHSVEMADDRGPATSVRIAAAGLFSRWSGPGRRVSFAPS